MAVKSMTGYGRGESIVADKKLVVEIRTLNGKQMDISLKMPSAYREKEFDIRSAVTEKLLRGKCDIFVNLSSIEGEQVPTNTINRAVFESYYKQMVELGESLGFNGSDGEIVQSILRMPDVMLSDKGDKNDLSKEELEALTSAVKAALIDIDSFREKEGEVLVLDLLSRIDIIEQLKNSIAPFAAERIETVKNRLRDSIDTLKVSVDENRFEQELIFYLEKYDITEEMVRLQQHLNHFRDSCRDEAAPGRKLGFLSQEIGREINTTGSKANHSEIQKIVVRMKDELEKIKEQSLNIL